MSCVVEWAAAEYLVSILDEACWMLLAKPQFMQHPSSKKLL